MLQVPPYPKITSLDDPAISELLGGDIIATEKIIGIPFGFTAAERKLVTNLPSEIYETHLRDTEFDELRHHNLHLPIYYAILTGVLPGPKYDNRPHVVVYDVYDMGSWGSWSQIEDDADFLRLSTPPVVYSGEADRTVLKALAGLATCFGAMHGVQKPLNARAGIIVRPTGPVHRLPSGAMSIAQVVNQACVI